MCCLQSKKITRFSTNVDDELCIIKCTYFCSSPCDRASHDDFLKSFKFFPVLPIFHRLRRFDCLIVNEILDMIESQQHMFRLQHRMLKAAEIFYIPSSLMWLVNAWGAFALNSVVKRSSEHSSPQFMSKMSASFFSDGSRTQTCGPKIFRSWKILELNCELFKFIFSLFTRQFCGCLWLNKKI